MTSHAGSIRSILERIRPKSTPSLNTTCLSAFRKLVKHSPVRAVSPQDGELRLTVEEGRSVASYLRSCLGGAVTRLLMEVTTPIVTDSVCQGRYSAGMISTNVQICSGGGNKGACQGDSGGPFVVADTTLGGRYTLAGLTSWGINCGQGGVYTRVSAFRPWVEATIGSTLP